MPNEITLDGVTTRKGIVKQLPKDAVVAELGVFKGKFAQFILDTAQPKELHLIDCWQRQKRLSGVERIQRPRGRAHAARYESVVARFAENENVIIHKGFTATVVNEFQDHFFDWIYIDADHTYEGCSSDLRLYHPKVKPGGYIITDDYCDANNYWGVKKAVDEFCEEHELDVVLIPKQRRTFVMEAVIQCR